MTRFPKGLEDYAASDDGFRPAPVELWNPPDCGDIDMRISSDGTWHYLGTPIGRPAMVRLFASVLMREKDGRYCLVTPVEKIGIKVDDAPFIGVRIDWQGGEREQIIRVTTNMGETVTLDEAHALRVAINESTDEPSPYVHIRAGLEARLARAAFYELVERAVIEQRSGREVLGLWSSGCFFELSDDIEQWA